MNRLKKTVALVLVLLMAFASLELVSSAAEIDKETIKITSVDNAVAGTACYIDIILNKNTAISKGDTFTIVISPGIYFKAVSPTDAEGYVSVVKSGEGSYVTYCTFTVEKDIAGNSSDTRLATISFVPKDDKQVGLVTVSGTYKKSGGSTVSNVFYADKEVKGYVDRLSIGMNLVNSGKESENTYTITYNANGGTGSPASQTGNGSITLSNTQPTRNGYTFKGWATSASATAAQYQPGASYSLTEDVTLYAVWQKNDDPQQPKVTKVELSDIKLYFKFSTALKPTITADTGAKYTVGYSSSNPDIASVDENGNVTGVKKGYATITCTVTDETGNTVTGACTVAVKYAWWQWLIKIFLLGSIWYK